MLADAFGKRVLLLQGPVGPFFGRLARELEQVGTTVHKINFNAGDALFYGGPNSVAYRGDSEKWPAFLREFILRNSIDTVALFGDCRPQHVAAVRLVRELGKGVLVFEEGYLRPNFITIEEGGTNYHSSIPKQVAKENGYRSSLRPEQSVGQVFWPSAAYATFYALAERVLAFRYPHYRHHKDLTLWRQFGRWVRGGVRKLYYARTERGVLDELVGPLSKRYFLVALQVHDDFQVRNSEFGTVEAFVRGAAASFAKHASVDTHLVFKHHPMDRAHTDYTMLIAKLAVEHQLGGRLHYVHDLHLPELLKHARGTVVINSTVGLSSLHHNTPVFCASRTVYDRLAFRGALTEFWTQPGRVERRRVLRFQAWLRNTCQANGSFYGRLEGVETPTGVIWPSAAGWRRASTQTRGSLATPDPVPPSSKRPRVAEQPTLELASGEAE